MKIREDIPFFVDHEAGASAFDRHGIHEEIVLGGFGKNVGNGGRNLAIDADVDGLFVGQSGIARGCAGGGEISRGASAARQGGHADGLAPASSGPVRAEGDDEGGEEQAGETGGTWGGHGRNPSPRVMNSIRKIWEQFIGAAACGCSWGKSYAEVLQRTLSVRFRMTRF